MKGASLASSLFPQGLFQLKKEENLLFLTNQLKEIFLHLRSFSFYIIAVRLITLPNYFI